MAERQPERSQAVGEDVSKKRVTVAAFTGDNRLLFLGTFSSHLPGRRLGSDWAVSRDSHWFVITAQRRLSLYLHCTYFAKLSDTGIPTAGS